MNIELVKVQNILDHQNLEKVECEACIEIIDPGKMCIMDSNVSVVLYGEKLYSYEYYCLGCGQSYVESTAQCLEDDLDELSCVLSSMEEYKE